MFVRCFGHGTGERSSFDSFGFRVFDLGMGFRRKLQILKAPEWSWISRSLS